jgi:hypothetical protein
MLALKLSQNVTIFEEVRLGDYELKIRPAKKFLEIFTKLRLSCDVNRITKGFAHIKTKYKFFFISGFFSLTALKICNRQKDEYL